MKSTIREIRLKLGMSQNDLAVYLGKTAAAISNYENWIRRPDVETAYKILELASSNGISKKLEDIYPPLD